jgi:anti-sigma factor RsiW
MMRRLRMRLFGLRCRHVVEILTDYLDGALDPATVSRIDEHLAGCDGCDAALQQFRMTISLTGSLSTDDVASLPSEVRSDLLAAFRDQSGR